MKRSVRTTLLILFSVVVLISLISVFFGYSDIPIDDLKDKYAQSSSFMEMDGMNVHFRDEGESDDSVPILLLHGTGSSLHTYDDWAAALKSSYRVIRLDLPAYGLTGPFPEHNYSMDNYVKFLTHFLAGMGIDKCILVGNSFGGNVAWNFTAKNSDKVDKLVLIDASGYPLHSKSVPIAFRLARAPVLKNIFTFISPRFIVRSSVENVYADKRKVTDALVDRYFELSLRKGNRQAFIDRFSMELDTTAHLKIPEIQQPTLVLWGDQDLLIPVEVAHRFHRDLPNDTLVIMNGTGHVPMEESPEESVEILLSFLKNP